MENNEIINKIYIDTLEEEKIVDNRIATNRDKIREIEIYIDSILTEENNNMKVFSPRNPANINYNDISQKKSEKERLEYDNRLLYRDRNKIEERLEGLRQILGKEIPEKRKNNMSQKIQISDDSKKILDVQEAERQRIAVELHDTTIQNLTHTLHMLELSSKYVDIDPIRAKLEVGAIQKYVKQTIEELRNMIYDLRPMTLDDIGLIPVLDKLYQDLLYKSDMKIDFEIDPMIDKVLTDKTDKITLYRIINECCQNSIIHSKGTSLKVVIRQEESEIYVKIEDDGIGFSEKEKANHYGLSIVNDRVFMLGGKINIETGKKGTVIVINLPIRKYGLEEM